MMSTMIWILFAVVALTHGQNRNNNDTLILSDNDISMSRRQYEGNVRDYDLQVESFEELYMERLNTVDIQVEMLVANLQQSHDQLYPLERLSDIGKTCINKYKPLLPAVNATKVNVLNCTVDAINRLESLVFHPLEIRNNLSSYYDNIFEKEIGNCKRNYSNTDMNYTTCITNAISNADMYTMANQEKFALEMAASIWFAGVHVNHALECSFSTQSQAISSIAEAKSLIDHCIQGWDDCTKCSGHFCENVAYMPGNMIDIKNETMINPFYGRNGTLNCLMLNVD